MSAEIYPEEILIDSSNLPSFDSDKLEGRIERPLSRRAFATVGLVLLLFFGVYSARAAYLQISLGGLYATQARENQLSQQIIFADRGSITDRNGTPLAYNERLSPSDEFAERVYAPLQGLAHVVGYVQAPAKDSSGVYYRDVFLGIDGAERAFNEELSGVNGANLTETNAHGEVVSQSVTQPPVPGQKITLSIDAGVTQELYQAIASLVQSQRFQGGAGVIIDVRTGELLALTSYPEYSQNALEQGDAATVAALNSNPLLPFLNRATDGLYAPGSIVKPVVAAAALTEGVIDEHKQILSTGSISVPNPFDAAHPSVFLDWRPNGWVDMRHAIAVSSDVYFYEVGGGFEDQPGLGIERLDKYFTMFGFGTAPALAGFSVQDGTVPTIAWKAANFPADPTWRIGDTYHTAIGQYGVQVTPLQAALAAATIANGGELLVPTLLASSTPQGTALAVSPYALQVAREGMRLGVTEGIVQVLNFDFVHVAAKTGTAQVGVKNQYENSSIIGFFPYEHPRYAFAVILERAPTGFPHGSPAVMVQLLQWMQQHAPQYLQ